MSKQVILTGIRANNDLTIGNYFGAILPMIDMATTRAEEFQVNLFVPDLHSFTTPVDHSELQSAIWNNLRIFVASGLPIDQPDIHIYRQSYIPAHSEMTWILDCFTGFGQLERMTQFKDKAGQFDAVFQMNDIIANNYPNINTFDVKDVMKIFDELHKMEKENRDSATVGLFNYPVLMASDILLYNATYVPVGDDQTQHLEFTRDIAERLNSKFNQELFTVPKAVKEQHEFFGKDQGLRIKDLQDPTKKMSKSDETGKGVLFLNDNPDEAVKKIMSAETDSVGSVNLDWENQPGISNLLQILALLTRRDIQEVASEWQGNERYGDFKKAVADEMREFLTDLQSKLAAVNDEEIQQKLVSSEVAMTVQAGQTLLNVQKAVGLRA